MPVGSLDGDSAPAATSTSESARSAGAGAGAAAIRTDGRLALRENPGLGGAADADIVSEVTGIADSEAAGPKRGAGSDALGAGCPAASVSCMREASCGIASSEADR